jgi:hypothetical protein
MRACARAVQRCLPSQGVKYVFEVSRCDESKALINCNGSVSVWRLWPSRYNMCIVWNVPPRCRR